MRRKEKRSRHDKPHHQHDLAANRNRPLRYESLEDRRMLAVVTVTTDQDVVDLDDGVTSLREAIFATNTVPGPDEIVFDFGHDGPATILLTEGELQITDSLTISGPGAELLTIDASGNDPTPFIDDGLGSRVFNIDDGDNSTDAEAWISGVTLTGGDVQTGGGAIRTYESITLDKVWITGNAAVNSGGIQVSGSSESAQLRILRSTISGNTARTVLGGRDPHGGYASAVGGSASYTRINQSTISGNKARSPAVFLFGKSIVTHSTISENIGGGVFVGWNNPEVKIVSSIVAGNSQRFTQDIHNSYGSEILASYSLIGYVDSSVLAETLQLSPDTNGNLVGGPIDGAIDPFLAPLADNGGPTPTHALLPGSPAINAGDLNAVAGVAGVPLHDQRGEGFDRIVSRIDIGAYEVQELGDMKLVVDTLTDESDGDYSRGDLSLREAIELANANPVPDTIRFDESLHGGTILLTMGELEITDSLTINGPGAELLTIDASGNDPTPIIDDELGSRVFRIDSEDNSNRIHVTLEGITLTGGDTSFGGAIYSSENLHLVESTITGNTSSRAGGGIYARSGVTRIYNSLINNNSAGTNGGAIRQAFHLYIYNSIISENQSVADGGGISTGFPPPIERLAALGFDGEDAIIAPFVIDDARVRIDNTIIHSNKSQSFGGGIFSWTSLQISHSQISENVAEQGGGGIQVVGAPVTITSSSLINNSTAGNGGGVSFSNGAFITRGGTTPIPVSSHMINSTISGNSAHNHGGGIFINSPDQLHTMRASTITRNTSDLDFSRAGMGGGVFIQAGTLNLDHTIVASNHDNSGVGPDLAGILGAIIHPNYSIISSNRGTGLAEAPVGSPDSNGNLIGGANSRDAINPRLAPLADNGGPTLTHALLSGSPAIDAGDWGLQPGGEGLPEFDQRGAPFVRVFAGRIDIGAYESQPDGGALNGDFDRDGDVDGADFLAWQRGYGSVSQTEPLVGDATYDGDVDGNDLSVWQATLARVTGRGRLRAIEAETDFAAAIDLAIAQKWQRVDESSLENQPSVDWDVNWLARGDYYYAASAQAEHRQAQCDTAQTDGWLPTDDSDDDSDDWRMLDAALADPFFAF